MKLPLALALTVLCVGAATTVAARPALADDDARELLPVDRALFHNVPGARTFDDKLLDSNFSWTDSNGNTRSKSEIVQDLKSGKGLPLETGSGDAKIAIQPGAISAHVEGQLGVIQEESGTRYVLRVWAKQADGWKLLLYHAVSIGAPPTSTPGNTTCENPCSRVPFEPQNETQRDVIHAYQSVERAVTAHDSAAWASHIADEFFAVTSNSDRPMDKATRMAGLDKQKEGGIAPFPLVSARMFEFGDAMVMISRQQPENGLALHVTRVWFKRNGTWLEAYSYQTTIQPNRPSR